MSALAVAKPAAARAPVMAALVRTLPGLWCEVGGVDRLVMLDIAAVTPGMVVVGRLGEDWARRPELRWQAWPEDLEAMAPN